MDTPPRDPYGAARHGTPESVRDRRANVLQRQQVATLLEEAYATLLRRGVHAEVTVTFTVVNGIIQADMTIGVVRHHRVTPATE